MQNFVIRIVLFRAVKMLGEKKKKKRSAYIPLNLKINWLFYVHASFPIHSTCMNIHRR